jgi:hypothetical protein
LEYDYAGDQKVKMPWWFRIYMAWECLRGRFPVILIPEPPLQDFLPREEEYDGRTIN